MPGKVHTAKFDRCVEQVKTSSGVDNPHAVCMASLGKEKAVLASHRNSDEVKPTQSDPPDERSDNLLTHTGADAVHTARPAPQPKPGTASFNMGMRRTMSKAEQEHLNKKKSSDEVSPTQSDPPDKRSDNLLERAHGGLDSNSCDCGANDFAAPEAIETAGTIAATGIGMLAPQHDASPVLAGPPTLSPAEINERNKQYWGNIGTADDSDEES